MKRSLTVFSFLSISLLAVGVSAQEPSAPTDAAEPANVEQPAATPASVAPASAAAPAATAEPFPLTLSIGLKGGLVGSAVSGVPEDQPFHSNWIDPNYYPMFGLGGAVGVAMEARVIDILGLETGLHISYDNGDGYEDINTVSGQKLGRINQKQRTTAYHIPLMLKASVPNAMVRPTFGIGAEFVLQQDSTIEYDNAQLDTLNDIETSSYTMIMTSFALEFDLGVVRVPLELRFGYNLGFGSTASDRVRVDGDSIQTSTRYYNGAYQGHFGIFTGIIYDYDLFL